ncbi:uncharacterized protein LOC111042771 [Myzus persicae]|uniref:uncharacterized protein LOC111042771 n=1 Tax=Myzus persicae TaxID=13164 RepID=UPI000B932F60|nr:uncharacterized protein LOC111042771 [Myzus persicae]
MAGSIIDNAAIYKKKTFAYVPPSAPAPLLDSTSFTLDFTARKFLLVGIDPTDNFQTVIHLLTSSRHVKLSTDFLKRIFSLMGNVLSFILDIPQSYKRTIFLETDFYKLSSMVYGGINVLVIESKTEDGCRILLNRADLIQLQRLEWSISASIGEKVVFIKPKIIKEMNQYCDYLAKQFLQVDSPKPQNVHEMLIFINNEEDKQSSQNQYLSQIKMFASTQLAELCMTRLKTQNSQVSYDTNFRRCSSLSPNFSPASTPISRLYGDHNGRDGFNQSDDDDINFAKVIYMDSPLSPSYSPVTNKFNVHNDPPTYATLRQLEALDHIDGPRIPDEISNQQQSVDVNDGPDFYNGFHTPSPSNRATFVEHPTPLRKVKRRLF